MRHMRLMAPAVILLAAGCADGTGPASAIDDTETADIVIEADAMAGSILFGQVLLAGFDAGSDITIASGDIREFSRSRECPLGGSISVTGQIERTITDEAAEFTASASGSWNGCVRGHRRNDHTFTIDGTFAMTAFRRYVNRQPTGPQTMTKSGSFAVTRDDGESRSCEYSVTSTRYPEENRRVVQGTVCGREINREVTWSPSDG